MISDERDRLVFDLYEQLLEVEQRLIPIGLHTIGQPPTSQELRHLLRIVASFDRPDVGARSLPDLVASGLGLPPYEALLKESIRSQERLHDRQKVETIVTGAIDVLLAGPAPDSHQLVTDATRVERAAAHLEREAAVSTEESLGTFRMLEGVRERLSVNQEIKALVQALRGEYIEPGPGADIIQNPNILPTGRNTHAVNPYGIPSPFAFQSSEATVNALLDRHRREQGRYPAALAMVLWGMDNIKTQGEGVAQALWLLGVKPRRDGMNRVSDVDIIPLERLGRPRIDVVMTVSGIFRDLFGATVELLDKAVGQVAGLEEPSQTNFLRKHAEEQMADGISFEQATVRIFSNAAGNYGTNVDFMVLDSQWDQADDLGDLFVTRKCFAYGRRWQGKEARRLMDRALSRVEATYQNIDSSEVGITDVDHYFEYLGGVTQAVEKRAGARPRVYLSDSLSPSTKIRSLEETVRLETRAKTLNPKWYQGMLKHGYRGVAEIETRVSNTYGWSATASAVDHWIYDEIAITYILDSGMLDRLRSLNPHSTRNLVGRLLEAHGRGFWKPSTEALEQLHDIMTGLENQLEGVS